MTAILVDQLLDQAVSAWAGEAYLTTLNQVRANLSGIVLKRQTGRLRDSIPLNSKVNPDGFEIGTNVIYGIAWERGFHRKAYAINPRTPGGVLSWEDSGASHGPSGQYQGRKRRFAKYVFIPAQDFAARPWLRPAIDDTMERNVERLRQRVEPVLHGIFPDWTVDIRIVV